MEPGPASFWAVLRLLPLGYWFFCADMLEEKAHKKKKNIKKTSSGQTVAPCQSPHMILTLHRSLAWSRISVRVSAAKLQVFQYVNRRLFVSFSSLWSFLFLFFKYATCSDNRLATRLENVLRAEYLLFEIRKKNERKTTTEKQKVTKKLPTTMSVDFVIWKVNKRQAKGNKNPGPHRPGPGQVKSTRPAVEWEANYGRQGGEPEAWALRGIG